MHTSLLFRRSLVLIVIVFSGLAGCSFFPNSARMDPADENRVMGLLNDQKPDEALAVANKTVAGAPEDFQTYRTRSTVYLALRRYDEAQIDNVKALQLIETGKSELPKEKQPATLAQIHESMALTALIAARRAPDEVRYERWIKVFQEQADRVKKLDPATWTHMRDVVESPDAGQ